MHCTLCGLELGDELLYSTASRTGPVCLECHLRAAESPELEPGQAVNGHWPGRRVVVRAASCIKPEPVRFLWEERWPLGALTLVAGEGGSASPPCSRSNTRGSPAASWPASATAGRRPR